MIIRVSDKLQLTQHLSTITGHEEKNWLVRSVWYMLDWRIRKLVRLKEWLSSNITMQDTELTNILLDNKIKIPVQLTDVNTLYDKFVIDVLRLVYLRTNYVPDDIQFGTEEYWQTPMETWNNKKGDCEDFAILIFALCRVAGVPSNRIRIVAGDVEGGGHAWVRYIPDFYPFNAVYIDGTYWISLVDVPLRKFYWDKGEQILEETLANQNLKPSKYFRFWWGVTDENEYGSYKPIYSRDKNGSVSRT